MLTPLIKGLLSVQELSVCLKQLIKDSFPFVAVYGEISNLKHSNHITYFTLKDKASQISVVVFQSTTLQPLSEGQSIIVEGRLDLYIATGRYQIIAKSIKKIGLGLLQQRFEALKLQLKNEGLFAHENKHPIPTAPKNIGLITAKDSAAFHDFISILKRNQWAGTITLNTALVQGNSAVSSIIKAFRKLHRIKDVDIIVIIRGGGSFEDLNCFNDETLIRTLAERTKPLITGIGHEVDTTLCDFVADYRAETPTAAAKFISDNYQISLKNLHEYHFQIIEKCYSHFKDKQYHFHFLRTRLSHFSPHTKYLQTFTEFTHAHHQLLRNYKQQIHTKSNAYFGIKYRFANLPITFALQHKQTLLNHLQKRLLSLFKQQFTLYLKQSCQLAQRLESLSMERQLQRGLLIPLDHTAKKPLNFSTLRPNEQLFIQHNSGCYQIKVLRKI